MRRQHVAVAIRSSTTPEVTYRSHRRPSRGGHQAPACARAAEWRRNRRGRSPRSEIASSRSCTTRCRTAGSLQSIGAPQTARGPPGDKRGVVSLRAIRAIRATGDARARIGRTVSSAQVVGSNTPSIADHEPVVSSAPMYRIWFEAAATDVSSGPRGGSNPCTRPTIHGGKTHVPKARQTSCPWGHRIGSSAG